MNTVKEFISRHPQLSAWFVLAVGMVAILLWSVKDVGLLSSQVFALTIATILVAGLCVWIIGWEDEEPEEAEQVNTK